MSCIEKLVKEFAENVAAQTDAIRRADPKASNKHAKRYIHAFTSLKSFGDQGRDALKPLMHDGSEDVQAMAATFLLRHCTEDALHVLQELAQGKGYVAFCANEALKRWQEGEWTLDPLEE